MAGDDIGGIIVLDTMVFSWMVARTSEPHHIRYRSLLQGRAIVVASQTVAEVRYGARLRNWGPHRLDELEDRIRQVTVVGLDDETVDAYVDLRIACRQQGLALSGATHEGDRWIAATAIRLGLPLVSHDKVFLRAPGLNLITELPDRGALDPPRKT